MRFQSRHLLVRLCAPWLLLWAVAAPARAGIDVSADALDMPGMQLQHVEATLGDGDGPLRLHLRAKRADIDALGWRRVGIDLEGGFVRSGRQRWRFAGTVKLNGAPGGLLRDGTLAVTIDVDANTLQVDLGQGRGTLSAALPLDQPSHAQINLDGMPLAWLQGLLAKAWSGRLTGGRVDGLVVVDRQDGRVHAAGDVRLRAAGFDGSGGTVAGQGVSASGRLNIDIDDDASRIDVDSSLRGGELLLGSLYAKLPTDHDVRLVVSARSRGAGLQLQNLRVADPDALNLEGSIGFAADGSLRTLDIRRFQATLPAAYARYGKAWLSTLGIENLRGKGRLGGHFALGPDGPTSFSLVADDVDLTDPGLISVSGLDGALDWARSGSRPATRLGWKSLRLYSIPNGAAEAKWRSVGGALTLQQALDVPVLGGTLSVRALDWKPAAARGQRLQTSLVMTGIDLPRLCKAFGWPAFKGTLAGAIPGLRYVDDRFDLDGGLSLNVFGGFVDVTRLSLQQPFGSTPVLAGDMHLHQLDLGAITDVFDFGKITGRMHGSVKNLRLVSWNPVAFDASLLADDGGRISQRAVNNLTEVGGGGVAAGLQSAVLKLFDSFGYRRIGLRCTLQGSTCHMDGLEPEGDGFLIVDGRGLPHLKVVGHQREVSWPTLVARLKAAIESGGPVVD